MNSRFTVELSSDLDYEGMVVYLSLDNQLLAVLNCERGMDNIEIEFFPVSSDVKLCIPYIDYLEVLEFSKNTLIQSNQSDGADE